MRESLDLERAWTAIIVGLMLLLTGYMAMQLGVIPAVWSDDQAPSRSTTTATNASPSTPRWQIPTTNATPD